MSDAHRIDIEPVSLGDRGRRYRVHHGGTVLIESTGNPEFDACRALLAKGITGGLEMWHRGDGIAALRLDIEKGARLTVEESDKTGPRITCWQPRSDGDQKAISDGGDETAISSSGVSPRTGSEEGPEAGPYPDDSAKIQPPARPIPQPPGGRDVQHRRRRQRHGAHRHAPGQLSLCLLPMRVSANSLCSVAPNATSTAYTDKKQSRRVRRYNPAAQRPERRRRGQKGET
jgi:hypothetical protein